jgi:hypothetical protein
LVKKILAGFFAFSVSFSAYALQVNNATVTTLVIDGSGIVRATVTGGSTLNEKPGCSQSSSGREFTFDVNSTAGSAWYSALLAAHTAKKKIHIIGGGSCLLLWGSSPFETVSTVYLIE